MNNTNKAIIIGILILMTLITGCANPPYTDGTCGSLCLQKECRSEGADCGINPLGEILAPSSEALEFCMNFCYNKENNTNQKKC